MFVILKQTPLESDEVLRLFYCSDITTVRNWIKDYIGQDIKNYSYMPNRENTKYVTYELNDGENNLQLLRKYKQIYKGYVYNSSERITDVVYTVSILQFDNNRDSTDLNTSSMLNDLQTEINTRVIRQLEQESLVQVLTEIQSQISTRQTWNRTEYTGLVTNAIKRFKKDLYNSIAKKLRRFDRRNSLYKNKNKQD